MRGMGEPQKQIGDDGFGVSGAPDALPIRIGPMEIGNRHSQQTSEIGIDEAPGAGLRRRRPGRQESEQRQSDQEGAHGLHCPPPARVSPARVSLPSSTASSRGISVDAQMRAVAAHQRGRGGDAEARGEPPALVEEEGPPVAPREIERTPRQQDDLRRPAVRERPGDFRVAPAVDEQQIAGERGMDEGVDPRPGAGDERAVGRADVAGDLDRGVEGPRARQARGRDPGDRLRFLQSRTDALTRLRLEARHLAGALQFVEPRLDLHEKIGLGHRPAFAANAEVLRGQRRRRRRDRHRHEADGREGPEGRETHHRRVSGTSVSAAGPASSGPTRGPSRPSQGISGSAIARPRMRSRDTGPISAYRLSWLSR